MWSDLLLVYILWCLCLFLCFSDVFLCLFSGVHASLCASAFGESAVRAVMSLSIARHPRVWTLFVGLSALWVNIVMICAMEFVHVKTPAALLNVFLRLKDKSPVWQATMSQINNESWETASGWRRWHCMVTWLADVICKQNMSGLKLREYNWLTELRVQQDANWWMCTWNVESSEYKWPSGMTANWFVDYRAGCQTLNCTLLREYKWLAGLKCTATSFAGYRAGCLTWTCTNLREYELPL